MPRRSNGGGNQRVEPTAPPIHLMPANNSNQCTNGSGRHPAEPPPRYEEAIADTTVKPSQHHQPMPLRTSQLNQSSSLAESTRTGSTSASRDTSSSRLEFRDRGSHWQRREQHENNPIRRSNNHRHSDEYITSSSNLNGSDGPGRARGEIRANRSGRFRSASPSQASEQDLQRGASLENSQDNDRRGGNDSPSSCSAGKKRKAGYKIKKGLENIAFFIIQILD